VPRSEEVTATTPVRRWSWQSIRAALPEALRFATVGTASAGLYFALLGLLALITRLSLTLRATLAYGIGIIFNYLVQRSFTFRSVRQHAHAGPRHVVVQLGGLAINSAVLWLGVEVEHWWAPAVQMGAIALSTIWSYLGQKFWAFRSPGTESEGSDPV
jgi:putative flippase GtrA